MKIHNKFKSKVVETPHDFFWKLVSPLVQFSKYSLFCVLSPPLLWWKCKWISYVFLS